MGHDLHARRVAGPHPMGHDLAFLPTEWRDHIPHVRGGAAPHACVSPPTARQPWPHMSHARRGPTPRMPAMALHLACLPWPDTTPCMPAMGPALQRRREAPNHAEPSAGRSMTSSRGRSRKLTPPPAAAIPPSRRVVPQLASDQAPPPDTPHYPPHSPHLKVGELPDGRRLVQLVAHERNHVLVGDALLLVRQRLEALEHVVQLILLQLKAKLLQARAERVAPRVLAQHDAGVLSAARQPDALGRHDLVRLPALQHAVLHVRGGKGGGTDWERRGIN
eukprot:86396-Chlamydomonas_euryale.AAC.10